MKMKTKKKLSISLLLWTLVFFNLTACLPLSTQAAKPSNSAQTDEMTVHFLDVEQGLSILVQSQGETLLYDGGDRDTSSFLVSYLERQKVDTIDYLISSHYDSDHLAGLIGALKAFSVENVIGSDYQHDSKLYQSFLEAVEKKGLKIQHPKVGETFSFGAGSFTVLSPERISSNSNDNSVAIKLENGANTFLFTGDAEHSSEADMINSGIDLDCDVLVPGHHGSATATSWDFLQATVPEYAVISCGADNSYGHPDKDTMDKLKDMEISVFRTDKQGTVTATSDGSQIHWSVSPCDDYTPGASQDTGTQPQKTDTPKASPTAGASDQSNTVWLSKTGKKYHRIPNCGQMNPSTARQITKDEAQAEGYQACKKCF